MAGGQVIANEAGEPATGRYSRLDFLPAFIESCRHGFPDKSFLRVEVAVKRAVCEARIGHQPRQAYRRYTPLAELPRCDVQDPLARGFLMSFVVAHGRME